MKVYLKEKFQMEFSYGEIIFITWLQGDCVYAHTSAWGHRLHIMHFIPSLCGQKCCVLNWPLHYINDMKNQNLLKVKN